MRTKDIMKTTISMLAISALLAACGTAEEDDDDTTGQPLQCGTAEYIAFDPANHMNQELRVGAYTEMLALMNAAQADPSLAAANFAEAKSLYEDTASLREKVMGRKDDHFPDQSPGIGEALDAAIIDGLDMGTTATTALGANLAKQKVDKTLIHFLYLSVFHEMVLGARDKWDEAYGYWGAGSSNDEGTRQGFAAVATKRDATNNTNLADSIFNGLVDGSCELAKALDDAGVDEIDYTTVPALQTIVEKVDLDMQKVLAFSAGHEAFEMTEIQEDLAQNPTQEARDEMWIKLAELDPYFKPLEPLMLDAGGDSAARATRIRTAIDAAWADDTGAWMSTFDAQGVVDDLEAQYQIDIKG